MIRVTTFEYVPEFAQGYVRDCSVRWALEEAGIKYETRLISRDEAKSDAYMKQQPFGQVPVYEEDDLVMFESGAIVLHIAETSPKLLPKDAKGRAMVQSWMFAVMNSIDPFVRNYQKEEFRALAIAPLKTRLEQLAKSLGEKDYLIGPFSAADILMTQILRNLGDAEVISKVPSLVTYLKRTQARPAFAAAMVSHMATFKK